MADTSKKGLQYHLVESSQLDELKTPLRGRLKFTCLDVSSQYIAIGSNTGSVYTFGRSSLKNLQVVFPEAEPSSVNCVQLCTTHRSVAFSTINGHIFVMELNIEKRQKPEKLRTITEHLHSNVTCLQWDSTGQKLYSADTMGRVVVSFIPQSKVKNLVAVPLEVIMKLETAVIQLDFCLDRLLVSTLTKSYLCYTSRQQFLQIGKKPRDGHYGGCFLQLQKPSTHLIFCARPGSRLWEVDLDGNVQHTHQFKQLLAIPPANVVNIKQCEWKQTDEEEHLPLGINFPLLKAVSEKFILTWNKAKLFILDPLQEQPHVVLWSQFDSDIHQLCPLGSDIYVFLVNGDIHKLSLLTTTQTVSLLAAHKLWSLAAMMCSIYKDSLLASMNHRHLSCASLRDIYNMTQSSELSEYESSVFELYDQYRAEIGSGSETDGSISTSRSRSSSGASIVRLDSGIYQINSTEKGSAVENDDEIGSFDTIDSGRSLNNQSKSSIDNSSHNIDKVSNILVDYNDNNMDDQNVDITENNDQKLANSSDAVSHTVEAEVADSSDAASVETEVPSSENKTEDFNYLINSDDIFADDVVATPKKSKKTSKHSKEPEPVKDPENRCSLKDSEKDTEVDKMLNGDLNLEVFDAVPEQDKDISPLIISQSHHSYVNPKKTSTRRKVTTVDIVTQGVQKNPEGSARRRRHSSKGRRSKDKNNLKTDNDDGLPVSESSSSLQESNEKSQLSSQSAAATLTRAESCPAFQSKHSSDTDLNDVSPSHSPLSQSWEDNNRRTLSSVKDSLQSKLASTKLKILKTIKEKKIASKSPRDDSDQASQQEIEILKEEELEEHSPEISPDNSKCDASSSVVDTENFILYTQKTMSDMHNVNVLLNPDKLWEVLSLWIKELNLLMKQMNTALYLKKLRDNHNKVSHNQLIATVESTSSVQHDGVESAINDKVDDSTSAKDNSQEVCVNDTVDCSVSAQASDIIKTDHQNIQIIPEDMEKFSMCDVTFVEDPFNFPPDVISSVAELTKKCFVTGCFCDMLEQVQPESPLLCDICHRCFTNDSYPVCDTRTKMRKTSDCLVDSGHSAVEQHSILKTSSEPAESISDVKNSAEDTYSTSSDQSVHVPIQTSQLNGVHGTFSQEISSQVMQLERNDQQFIPNAQNHEIPCTNTSIFIRLYYFLLCDSDINAVLQDSQNSEQQLYAVWCSILNCCQVNCKEDATIKMLEEKDISQALSMMELRKHDTKRILGYISKLFQHSPSKAVAFSIECDNICPLDILFLCYYHHKPEAQFLNQFLCGRYKHLPTPRKTWVNFFGHSCVLYKWLCILLNKTSHEKQLKDEDGNPSLQSHLVKWNEEDMIVYVLETAKETELNVCVDICRDVGYWRGCLKLLKKLQNWEEIVSMVFHLGALNLLTGDEEKGFLPETENDWRTFVKLYHTYHQSHSKKHHDRDKIKGVKRLHKEMQHQTSAENMEDSTHDSNIDGPTDQPSEESGESREDDGELGPCEGKCLTWNSIVSLMLRYLENTACVKILKEFPLEDGCIDKLFFQSSIATTLKQRQQKNVMHNLLEKIDSYLWTKKPNTLMPELQFAMSVEKKSKGKKEERSMDELMTVLSETSTSGKRYREDLECHWGIQTNVLRCCRICNLSLTESISHVEPGILVFECGHGFHKYCCRGRTCVVCNGKESQDHFIYL